MHGHVLRGVHGQTFPHTAADGIRDLNIAAAGDVGIIENEIGVITAVQGHILCVVHKQVVAYHTAAGVRQDCITGAGDLGIAFNGIAAGIALLAVRGVGRHGHALRIVYSQLIVHA